MNNRGQQQRKRVENYQTIGGSLKNKRLAQNAIEKRIRSFTTESDTLKKLFWQLLLFQIQFLYK